jgi:hypothetical protein
VEVLVAVLLLGLVVDPLQFLLLVLVVVVGPTQQVSSMAAQVNGFLVII